jgi:hypothetical protein
VVVALAHEPHRLERLDHLEAQRPHCGGHPVVAVEGVGGSDGELTLADAHRRVAVDDAEVGIHPDTGQQERFRAAPVGVEVEAVIGVAIRADDVGHRERGLVDRELVKRVGHGFLREDGGRHLRGAGSEAGSPDSDDPSTKPKTSLRHPPVAGRATP